MRVRVFETDDPYSEQPVSLGPVRDVELGQQGSSPEQILQLLSLQFPGVRLFAFNSQDQELPGWEEITVANAANLPAFLAHRKQLKAVRVPTAAARMLTRLQVVNSTAQPLTYATPCIATTSDPIAALLHLPDDMKEWTGVEEAATAFSARIPDSEPVFDGWSPCKTIQIEYGLGAGA
ncbi:hypothetical protein COCOBI_14-0410 [Coccomyxa sp. Obi]|nr:hypothetical protein COCOBI_14-0410 [Coccomyxa sp. Obi]